MIELQHTLHYLSFLYCLNFLGKQDTTFHGFLSDLRYLEELNVKFKVSHVIAVVGKTNIKLQNFCRNLINLKKDGGIKKIILKDIALSSLGRSALNVRKFGSGQSLTVQKKSDFVNLLGNFQK